MKQCLMTWDTASLVRDDDTWGWSLLAFSSSSSSCTSTSSSSCQPGSSCVSWPGLSFKMTSGSLDVLMPSDEGTYMYFHLRVTSICPAGRPEGSVSLNRPAGQTNREFWDLLSFQEIVESQAEQLNSNNSCEFCTVLWFHLINVIFPLIWPIMVISYVSPFVSAYPQNIKLHFKVTSDFVADLGLNHC